jgi:type IV fimbrial biogenesis protein FimT
MMEYCHMPIDSGIETSAAAHGFRYPRAGCPISGFTMVELMATLALFAILLTIAAPSFREYTANQAIKAAGFTLASDLVYTRSEAVTRNTNVTIAPIGGDWTRGWTVSVVAPAQTLRQATALGHGVKVDTSAPAAITFDATGRVSGAAGVVQLPVSVTLNTKTVYRCISLDPAGMPRSSTAQCS